MYFSKTQTKSLNISQVIRQYTSANINEREYKLQLMIEPYIPEQFNKREISDSSELSDGTK